MKYVAVDLGIGAEPTSLVVLDAASWKVVRTERRVEEKWISYEPVFLHPDGHETTDWPPPPDYHLRHVERFPPGTSYVRVAQRVRELMKTLGEDPVLVLDATGVGKATTDLFKGEDLSPRLVTVTAGTEVTEDSGKYRVPKTELISTAQVVLQAGRLKIAKGLAHADLLVKELQSFRMKVPLGKENETASWREGANDDLVLALATGLWMAETHPDVPLACAYGRSEFGDDDEPINWDAWRGI